MSLWSWRGLSPRKEIQSNKDALRDAYRDELVQIIVQSAIHGKRANREDKYKDFMATYKETRTTIRRKE